MARPGLRLTEQQRTELTEEFRVARGNKDLDMCLRIQALLHVSRGHREAGTADAIGVGHRTVRSADGALDFLDPLGNHAGG